MALLNNIYVLVETEDITNDTETVNHPTESGFPVSDTIRKKPVVINLSGIIANAGNMTAKAIIAKLKSLQNSGSLIKYVGQAGTFTSLQIQNFKENYSYKKYGGAAFDMTLTTIKTAKSAYVKPTNTHVTTKKVTTTKKKISAGDKVLFLGGAVYVASDSTKAAAVKSRSTCTLTKISSLKNAKHIYHLISMDGKGVYGWVDAYRVSSITSTTQSSTNSGKQQVQASTAKPIYHTVKRGDTIYKLVMKTYKGKNNGKNFDVNKTVNNNPKAFKKKGDPTTLIVGARLRMY